jgi:hypothetical protein
MTVNAAKATDRAKPRANGLRRLNKIRIATRAVADFTRIAR